MKRFLLFCLLILSILTSCNTFQSKKPALSHEEKMAKASRTEKNGWILIHVEGTPEVLGYQHGYLLANEIIDLRGAMAMLNEKTTGKNWDFYRDESYRLLWPKVPFEYKEEIKGIIEGVNARLGENRIDVKDLVAINSFIEMTGYYVPWLKQIENPTPPEHCSAFAATGSWTVDGKIVIAHNNWSEYVIGERWNIIMDIVPQNGNRILMDALPGLIHSGDDFNINSAGLIVTETTISNFRGFDTSGVAEFVRARKAIQYSSSIDEWVSIMKEDNNGGYANDWLVGDNKTGEIARLELGLKNNLLERTSDGCFTGANFPVNEKLIREETTFDPSDTVSSPNFRRLRWEELMREYKGEINVELAKAFMGDHFDMKRGKEKAGRYSLCGHLDEDETGKNEISWDGAHYHAGAVQGKATDGNLAGNLQFWAIMGHPCGQSFNAKNFLTAHPEYDFEKDYLKDMPGQEWILAGKIH
jgi:Phospholipase B